MALEGSDAAEYMHRENLEQRGLVLGYHVDGDVTDIATALAAEKINYDIVMTGPGGLANLLAEPGAESIVGSIIYVPAALKERTRAIIENLSR